MLKFLVFFFAFLYVCTNGVVDLNRFKCNLIQKKHSQISGVGMFAGRNYTKGEILERCVTFNHPEHQTDGKLLGNYVFAHKNDGNVAVVLGYAMVYNHHPIATVKVVYDTEMSARISDAFEFYIEADRDITEGEEIFSSYGADMAGLWFQNRGIQYVNPDQIDHISTRNNAENFPGCPLQLTEVMNNQLYATQNIAEGDIIEVARGLIVPASEAIEGSGLFRFAWHSPNPSGDAVILLLGNGALYPPVNSEGGVLPAVTYRWFAEDELDSPGNNNQSGNKGNNNSTSCPETVFIAFVATREIHANEPLTVPLIYDVKSAKRTFRSEYLPTSCF